MLKLCKFIETENIDRYFLKIIIIIKVKKKNFITF